VQGRHFGYLSVMESLMQPGPTIFADGLLDASVQHGVVRLTFGRIGPDNKPIASGLMVVPLTQLTSLTQGLTKLVERIEMRIKEAAPPPEIIPDSFTFGGR